MVSLDQLHSSPLQRARETADAIAGDRALMVEVVEALDELDFGDWSGCAFLELEEDSRWHRWNTRRSAEVAPNGESMSQVQDRAWRHIAQTGLANPGHTIAMVTHCDVIRAVVAKTLGLSLDDILRFEIGPASVSRLAVGSWGAKLLSLNEGGHE